MKKKQSSKRTARQQPSVQRKRESLLGQIPAPASAVHRAARAPARREKPETVTEYLARGGKVERLAGFERVRPYSVMPLRMFW